MLVFYKREPVLDISIVQDADFGLHRDRTPDRDWSELRRGRIQDKAEDLPATPELLQILLEDLAYTYGNNTSVFVKKLKEFNLTVIQIT